jgi:hypothetical protein
MPYAGIPAQGMGNNNANNATNGDPKAGGFANALGMSNNYNATDPNSALYAYQGNTAQDFNKIAGDFGGRQGAQIDPNAGNADFNRALQARQGQQGLADSLQNTINGTGMSAADRQLQQGGDQAMAQQMAMAHSAHGAGMGSALYNASQQGAQTNAQTNQALGIQRAQEAATAQGQLGNVYGQMSGLDVQRAGMMQGVAGQQAQLNQQQSAQNDQSQLAAYQMGNQSANSELQGGIAEGQANLQQQQINAQIAEQNAKSNSSLLGAGMSALGSALGSDITMKSNIQPMGQGQPAPQMFGMAPAQASQAPGAAQAFSMPHTPPRQGMFASQMPAGLMSDESSKTGADPISNPNEKGYGGTGYMGKQAKPGQDPSTVSQAPGPNPFASMNDLPALSDERTKTGTAPSEPERMLEQLRPYSYNYKPGLGEDPTKRRYGIMAQDMEKSPMGASVVSEDPATGRKVLDARQGFGVALAAMTDLHDRLKKLEAKRGK